MTDSKVIVALGDSITYGFPYTPTESWVYLAAARCGLSIINQGVCGDTTGGMAARFGRIVFKKIRPKAIILLGGANDVFSYIGLETMRDNMEDMVHRAEQQGILPILGLPTPCDFDEESQLAEFRLWLAAVAHTKSLPLIDFFTPLLNRNGKFADGLTIDGIHPSLKGYERMAEAAAPVIGSLALFEQKWISRLAEGET